MKTIFKNLIVWGVWVVSMSLTLPLVAQEWSAEQKKVWENVEAYSELASKGDVEGFMSYIHPDFSGWYSKAALPDDKSIRQKHATYHLPKTETLYYFLQPLEIKIHGNVAIVHYIYSGHTKDAWGKEKFSQSRWTDILMKQKDKWVIIGDHGGPVKIE